MEAIVNFFVENFKTDAGGYSREFLVFFISCMPILELRGGLLAASLLNISPITSYILCILGNILPVPFILWFIEFLFEKLKKTPLCKMVTWIEKKANSKKEKIEKFGYIGLVLFVGIPLPGTGAWTGCLIAALLGMDKKKSFLAALIGIFMASLIMMLISFGFLKMFI